MKSIDELLGDLPFFAGLPAETIELISGCAVNVHFGEDEQIIAEDAPADHFFLLRTGKVAIEIDTPRKGPKTIETLGVGQLLGVSWLVPPHRWTFSARAVESTSAIAIDAACLRSKCDDDPALGYEMLKRFSVLVRDRLQSTRLQLLDLYGSHAS
jgi:CRP/FNR family cyclic AMP-dependent transcriptional regulator